MTVTRHPAKHDCSPVLSDTRQKSAGTLHAFISGRAAWRAAGARVEANAGQRLYEHASLAALKWNKRTVEAKWRLAAADQMQAAVARGLSKPRLQLPMELQQKARTAVDEAINTVKGNASKRNH